MAVEREGEEESEKCAEKKGNCTSEKKRKTQTFT